MTTINPLNEPQMVELYRVYVGGYGLVFDSVSRPQTVHEFEAYVRVSQLRDSSMAGEWVAIYHGTHMLGFYEGTKRNPRAVVPQVRPEVCFESLVTGVPSCRNRLN